MENRKTTAAIVVFSILLSTLFGQSLDQFAFTDGFSCSTGGTSALLTILLAATIYVLNFLISVVPIGFLTAWVYVKNNRSMLACIIFHLFVNAVQEKIAMTPQTKCVETIAVTLAAVLAVMTNGEMFSEKDHIGDLLAEKT